MLEIIKVLITLSILLKASIEDLKKREIDDRLWIFMITSAIFLNTVEYIFQPFDLIFALIQFGIVFFYANIMYYLLRFGGADCKAIICLSIMFPTYPILFPWIVKGIVFTLSVLINSIIFAPIIALYFFIKNAIRGNFSKLMFIGYKVNVDEIPKFHNLLQLVKDGRVVCTIRSVEFNEKIVDDLKRLGKKDVWVTPALPFIVFITFGFIVAIVFGDILFAILSII